MSSDANSSEPMAIVGMSCRLPGEVCSPSDLWTFLKEGRNAQSKIPKTRFDVDTWYHPNGNRPGSVNANGGYFLSHDNSFRSFDPQFFGISPVEAKTMDPQQRKLCETVYECFESAGLRLTDLSGSNIGCFVGNFTSDAAYDSWKDIENPQPYQTTGVGLTILSNRINYLFNLKGPSMTIDTACSSTMYALHYACQSLRNRDCSAAIVGGTNLVFGLEQHVGSVALGALSPTSTCHTFDEAADGYGRADAVGSFLIKRLSDAMRNGDPIRAIIRGTAINANGRSSGISHPSVTQQETVIRTAYANARLPFGDTRYFECHGTGTLVGDPIEVDAIGRVFGRCRTADDPLVIGSVKTNLGHGEAASTVASLIKTTLILEKAEVPATIGIKNVNHRLKLLDGVIKINQSHTPWDSTRSAYRRASVNSFGYGGANAHAIVDAAECYMDQLSSRLPIATLPSTGNMFMDSLPSRPRTKFLLGFSAHDEVTLRKNVQALDKGPQTVVGRDLVFTLAARRSLFASRAFLQIDSVQQDLDYDAMTTLVHTSKPPNIAFVFTGQGAQWAQMGLKLFEQFSVVRSTFQRLDEALRSSICPPQWSILDVLKQPEETSTISETEKSQTLCTALQLAVVDLLKSWNVHALAVVGHSSGEIAASYAAGLITMEHAILAAYFRGLAAASKQQPGSMLAVGLSLTAVQAHIAESHDVVVACHNSPQSVTLSGTDTIITSLQQSLSRQGIFARKLKTSGNAYHSWLMSAAGTEYVRLFQQQARPRLTWRDKIRQAWYQRPTESSTSQSSKKPSTARMVSSVTGSLLEGHPTESYWMQNLLSPVRFVEAVQTMLKEIPEVDHLLEIGPHSTLSGPLKDIIAGVEQSAGKVSYLSTLKRGADDAEQMLQLAGTLFLKRYPIDLAAVNDLRSASQLVEAEPSLQTACKVLVDLPPYQWNYSNDNWSSSRLSDELKFRTFNRHDLLGSRVPGTSPANATWRNVLRLTDLPWIKDHQIGDNVVFPAAGYIAIALEAGARSFDVLFPDSSDVHLQSIHIDSALLLNEGTPIEIITETTLSTVGNPRLDFRIKTVAEGRWTEHAHGMILGVAATNPDRHDSAQPSPTTEIPSFDTQPVKVISRGGRWGINNESYTRMWFDAMKRVGMAYGPTFTILSDICVQPSNLKASALVEMHVTKDTMIEESRYFVHPTVIDAAFQLIVMAAHEGKPHAFEKPFIPTSIRDLKIGEAVSPDTKSAQIQVTAHRPSLRQISGQATIVDLSGRTILTMQVDCTALDAGFGDNKDSKTKHPYNRLIWRPDFDRLSQDQLLSLLPYRQDDRIVKHEFLSLEKVCISILLNDYQRLPNPTTLKTLPFHMQKFASWMRTQGERLSQAQESHDLSLLTPSARDLLIQNIVTELGPSVPEITTISKLHDHLLDILLGRVGALDIMVEDNVLSRVYEEGFSGRGAYDKLEGVLTLIGHKEPRLRVLEIGAGSGGATLPALRALKGNTEFPSYREYVFTDVSMAFLSRAREKFRDFRFVKYGLLDIEKDLESQDGEAGFEVEGGFDVIIASNVIHATSSIVETLRTCKKLLKSNGRLILIETTQIRLVTGLLVGQLPGYWLGVNDGRPDGPFISEEEWNTRLLAAGLSGADHVLPDYTSPYNSTSVIVSRNVVSLPESEAGDSGYASSHTEQEVSEPVYLIYLNNPVPLLETLELHYQSHGLKTRRLALSDLQTLETPNPIRTLVLIDLEETPILPQISPPHLEGLKHLTQKSSSTLWLSNSGVLHGVQPEKSLVIGLVRSVTIEEPSFRVATLDLSPSPSSPSSSSQDLPLLANLISTIESEFHKHPDTEEDYNFAEQDGILYVSRNTIDEVENEAFRCLQEVVTEWRPAPASMPCRLAFERHAGWEGVYFDPVRDGEMGLGDEQILVRLEGLAVDGLSLPTLLPTPKSKSKSIYPYHDLEAFGTITALGKSVPLLTNQHAQQDLLSVGDRVVYMTSYQQGTHLPVHASLCHVVRPGSVRERFLGQYRFFCRAWYVLGCLRGNIEERRVLVDVDGDGDGDGKEDMDRDPLRGAIGQVLRLNGARVLRGDDGEEVDVVIADAGRKGLEGFLGRVRRGGDVVLLFWGDQGREDERVSSLVSKVQAKEVSVRFVDLLDVMRQRENVERYMAKTHQMTATNFLTPLPTKTFELSELATAAKELYPGGLYGNILLKQSPGSLMRVRKKPEPVTFNPQASYLLIGCLGGLGRVITMWMISRGARNLIYLSRSGADKPEAASLVREVESLAQDEHPDLKIHIIRGDVSKAEDVEKAIRSAAFPIKGVVHAAMVLKESLFNTMTTTTWNQVVGPKVLGAKNLHEKTLDMDLDFFIMTSTILSVVGAATQSNYAAANAYLDHLARHRHSKNLQATSISIGMIVGVGYVEEHTASEIALRRNGMYGIDMEEFLHNFELSCRRRQTFSSSSNHPLDPYDPCCASNIITGMDPTRITRNSSKNIWQRDARLRHFLQALELQSTNSTTSTAANQPPEASKAGSPKAELAIALEQGGAVAHRKLLTQLLVEKIANFVMLPAAQVDADKSLSSYGMDSMIGAELRAWLQRELGADVPFLVLLDQNLTFEELAERVLGGMVRAKGEA